MIQYQLEKFPIDIGPLFFNFKNILQVPEKYLQAPAIYFQDFQKVVEYIPQLLHYSITCPPKSWWTSYR